MVKIEDSGYNMLKMDDELTLKYKSKLKEIHKNLDERINKLDPELLEIELLLKVKFPPVEVYMPWNLPRDELYRFLLYTYVEKFQKMYHTLVSIGGNIIPLEKVDIREIKMGSLKFNSALIDSINKNFKMPTKQHRCVHDFLWAMCRGKGGFKNYTYEKFIKEFNQYVIDGKKRPTTNEIINWRNECHPNISIYAINPYYKKFVSSAAAVSHGTRPVIKIAFMVKDNHCYPILNDNVITALSKGSKITNFASKIEWKDECDKLYECKNMTNFVSIIQNKIQLDNYLVILPDNDVIKYMLQSLEITSTYPDYFHFDSNNKLDGFISQSGKIMFVANNDFKDRQKLCNQIHEIYPNEKFVFKN
jgi:hypothetical protein